MVSSENQAVRRLAPWQVVILALQHLLAMFGATVLVPMLTGLNVSVALFTAGLGTLLFHLITKRKVPVFLGSSFAFIAPIVAVRDLYGLPYALGGIMAVGLVYALAAGVVYLWGPQVLQRLLPPAVTAPVVMVIGWTLVPVAIGMAELHWVTALITLAVVLTIMAFGKGFIRLVPIVLGVSVGYLAAIAFNLVDLAPVVEAPLVAAPAFVWPKFNFEAIMMIVPIALVTIIEHMGDIAANGTVVGKNFVVDPGLHRTLLGDGLASALAAAFGGPANTTYSENTGVLALTRVYDPALLRWAAVGAILLSFAGKFGALIQSIPASVMGGISLVLFNMIAFIGVKTVKDRVAINWRNLVIMGAVLLVGLADWLGSDWVMATFGTTGNPLVLRLGSVQLGGMGLAAVVGILLNLILPQATAGAESSAKPVPAPGS